MSGTSFDGVDAALIKTNGRNFIELIDTSYVEYSPLEKSLYNSSIIKNYKKITDIINNKHISAIKILLTNNSNDIDVIGLHGQTFYHKPNESWTWQYINSELIAKYFNVKVISDFRIKDINAGGEGAPLVPIFHKKLILNSKLELPAAILNIGGISNITVVTVNKELIGFDIGPGNGPLDKLMEKKLKINMDKDGELAKSGLINKSIKEKTFNLLNKKMNSNSFDRAELDDYCLKYLTNLSTSDGLATLVDLITDFIEKKIKKYNIKNLIITGGGRKNNTLVSAIKNKIEHKLFIAENLYWDGDSIEAQAFAYLAIRSLKGMPYTYKSTTGVKESISGGVLYNTFSN